MILIDMKMPHSCADCPLTYDSFDGSTVCTLHPGAYIDWDKRPDYCPLHNLRKDAKETKEESKDNATSKEEYDKLYEETMNKLKTYLDTGYFDPSLHDFDTATLLPPRRIWTNNTNGLEDDFPDVTF